METKAAGSTLYFVVNTHKADGTPITWAGSPSVAVTKDGGTTTETDGVSLSVGAGGVTGRHIITIDTSQDATFFATGHKFAVVVTAGTVDSVSTVGVLVAEFALGEVRADLKAWNGGSLPVPAEAGAAMTLTEAYDAAKTAAPSASTVAGAVLDEALGEHAGFLTTLLTAAGYTAPANSDITTLLERITATRAGYLDSLTNLDAAISSRLATSGYTAPQSYAQIQAAALAAIQAYDPPTDAEMDAAHALLATAAALATVDGIADSILEDTGTTIPALIGALHISQGSETCNYTVYDTDGVTPLSGVKVEVTTNEDGSGHVTTGWTDAFGIVTFKLDPGTYYLWRSRFDRVFVNPDIEVVE